MATSGALVAKMAEVLDMPAATLVVYDRVLRIAGLLGKNGRGPSAVHRTPRDAARILIALLVTNSPARAVAAVRDFGGLVLTEHKTMDPIDIFPLFTEICGLPDGHSFEDALTALLAGYGTADFRIRMMGEGAHVHVRDRDPHASIVSAMSSWRYEHPTVVGRFALIRTTGRSEGPEYARLEAEWSAVCARYRGIARGSSITQAQLAPIGAFLAGLNDADAAAADAAAIEKPPKAPALDDDDDQGQVAA